MATVMRMIAVAAALRLVMILFGLWQDHNLEVNYTDIDYTVFSDAAKFVVEGKSPFERHTYRYTPLLAYLLIPNILIHSCWGKLLFSMAELLVAFQIYSILEMRGISPTMASACTAVWLFNPFTFTIATRGNCEAVVSAMLLRLLLCLMNGQLVEAAFWHGLAVHFRIYPIIYSLPILLVLDQHFPRRSAPNVVIQELESHARSQSPNGPAADGGRGETTGHSSSATSRNALSHSHGQQRHVGSPVDWIWKRLPLPNREMLLFGTISGGVFALLSGTFWLIYGRKYLDESILYHLIRRDPRHNFSIYFYLISLQTGKPALLAERLVAFLPQAAVQVSLALRFYRDLPFCFFSQTMAFVAFNKVITAQYFVWFFCLLPLIIPSSSLRLWGRGLALVTIWVVAQLHWLVWAYLLEFEGQNVFIYLWAASVVFFATNVGVLAQIIKHHRVVPLFENCSVAQIPDWQMRQKSKTA